MEIIAHRGASAYAPENTLAAVKLAWSQGVDGVEIDVHLTRDQRLVVIHDDDLSRVNGVQDQVDSLTLAELQEFDVGSWKDPRWSTERVPSLAAVVQTIPPGKRLLVEVKCEAGCVEAFAADLALVADRPDAVTIIGFELPIMAACKQRYPQTAVYLVAEQTLADEQADWEPSIDDLIESAVRAKLDGLDMSNTLGVDSCTVGKIHKADLDCCIWTVNSVEDGERLRKAGVDSITTDDPLLFLDPDHANR
jgi:glycerophosphoryl diester phosphodiesterase